MTIDLKTVIAAQQMKAEILHWIHQQIRRDIRVRAANETAKQHALKREAEGRPKRKPKNRTQSPWLRGS